MTLEESRLLRIRVTPRAARTQIGMFENGVLYVRCSAPPVDGAANDACREAVADALGVAKSHVTLVRGERSREKTLRIEVFVGPWPWPGSTSP